MRRNALRPRPRPQWRSCVTERRVLVADDDAGIRESLRFLFEENDYLVEEAEDGIVALNLIRTLPLPRVLLLDRMMPRCDGVEVLRAITSLPDWRAQLAIVFITARSDSPDAALAALLMQTTTASLNKPFDLDRLVAAVAQAWASLPASQS